MLKNLEIFCQEFPEGTYTILKTKQIIHKMNEFKILFIQLMLFITGNLVAQNIYKIPAKQINEIVVDVYDSSIRVAGTGTNTVIVKLLNEKNEKPANSRDLPHFDIRINRNRLEVFKRESRRVTGILIDIEVPEYFNCQLDTHFGKKITVENIAGDVIANNHFGEIRMENLDGNIEVNSFEGLVLLSGLKKSAIVHNTQGDIQASFESMDSNISSIFSSNKGNIKIQLPSTISLLVAMDTFHGKIESEFEMGIPANIPGQSQATPRDYLYRTINGGGNTHLSVKNYFGNIELVKSYP